MKRRKGYEVGMEGGERGRKGQGSEAWEGGSEGGAFREGRKMGCKRLDEREGKLKGKEGGETNGECGRGRQGREGGRRTGGRAEE